MEKIYTDLKKSPLFHFSLHSKELFHSNFLAWLGMDIELRQIFKKLIEALGIDEKIIDSWGEDFEIKREFHDLDLIIKAPDIDKKPGEWYLVIENKVKSVPNDSQLENYTGKIKKYCGNQNDVIKILLSLGEYERKLPYGWREVNYSKIISALENNICLVCDCYKRRIIYDYISMMNTLIEITNTISIRETEKFVYQPTDEIETLRIDDLLVKRRASLLADYFTSATGFYFNAGYSNKSAIIETVVEMENDIKMGVQIQGNQYRHYIYGKINEKDIVSLSHDFLAFDRKNFRDKMIERFPNIFEDKKVKGEAGKPYCSYNKNKEGETFWYQYVVIKSDTTISEIKDCLDKDLQYLKQYEIIESEKN